MRPSRSLSENTSYWGDREGCAHFQIQRLAFGYPGTEVQGWGLGDSIF